MLTFSELSFEPLLELGTRLCAEDCAEVFGLGMTLPVALVRTFEMSVEGFLVYEGPLLIGAFGVCQGNDLVPQYRPWLVMSPEGRKYRRELLVGGRRIANMWVQAYGFLENYVDVNHTRAVKWLRYIGFTLDPATPIGPFGRLYHRFYMGDPDVC